jgi:hypothetical protein
MLYRSLYFVFCDERGVRRAIGELEREFSLNDSQLHAIVDENNNLHELPGATLHRHTGEAIITAKWIWYLSVAVFTFALTGLIMALLVASWYWAVLLGLVVLGTQISGYLFGNRIPNAQLDRFRTGMHRGNIVLQVDAPRQSADKIKHYLDDHYPGTVSNISNLHLGNFGM